MRTDGLALSVSRKVRCLAGGMPVIFGRLPASCFLSGRLAHRVFENMLWPLCCSPCLRKDSNPHCNVLEIRQGPCKPERLESFWSSSKSRFITVPGQKLSETKKIQLLILLSKVNQFSYWYSSFLCNFLRHVLYMLTIKLNKWAKRQFWFQPSLWNLTYPGHLSVTGHVSKGEGRTKRELPGCTNTSWRVKEGHDMTTATREVWVY